MRIACPNCNHELEVPDEATASDLVCPTCGSRIERQSVLEATVAWQPPPSRRFGRYQLLERLGRGQYGEVWKARDTQLDRLVALKIPRLDPSQESMAAAFLREAQAAAQVRHPNLVAVYEYGREGDAVYIASELIEGCTLTEWTLRRQPGPRETATMCALLAEALHEAHEAGIVHRDVKPGNILVDANDQPHLSDFGVAKRQDPEATATMPGQVIGTPAYMPPEQARGENYRVDRRSDVYSLGVVLYQMLTGRRPFEGPTRVLLQQILHDDPKPPRKLVPTVPWDLEKICLKAMAKEPRHRYATAHEMAQDLGRFVRGEPVRAHPPGWFGRAVRWVRRRPAISAAIGVAGAALGFTFLVMLDRRSDTALRPVRLATDPPGATGVFHPLDPITGEPQPERAVRPAKPSPIEVMLAPGEYLVVAVANTEGYSFHEVFRRVPRPGASFPEAHPHQSFVVGPDGVVELHAIVIPRVSVTEGMARFEGAAEFTVGTPAMQEVPPHRRNVPAFWLDATEVRVRDVQRADVLRPLLSYYEEQGLEPRPDDPMVFVGYDDAAWYAESVGKRLPTEWEYEYAATRRGTREFPWGDDAQRAAHWTFEAAGQPAWDCLDTVPPVYGLYSNVAEWTCSWQVPYPHHYALGLRPPPPEGGWRVVRGGSFSVVKGAPQLNDCLLGPRQRFAQIRQSYEPGLGFRCARSAKPRLAPEDFSRPLTE